MHTITQYSLVNHQFCSQIEFQSHKVSIPITKHIPIHIDLWAGN